MSKKENRSIKSISPYCLEKKPMSLTDLITTLQSQLQKGPVTIDTDYQWFATGIISPFKGYVLNISQGYQLIDIPNPNEASIEVYKALLEAGIQITRLPSQAKFFYLKSQEG